MTLLELLHDLIEVASEDPAMLSAKVEVHGHDGSWSWAEGARSLKLHDPEGPTNTVVIGVHPHGVRLPTQPIGKPASSAPVIHREETR